MNKIRKGDQVVAENIAAASMNVVAEAALIVREENSRMSMSGHAWRRACLSHANTAATWRIAHSAVHRFHVPFTHVARPASSSC